MILMHPKFTFILLDHTGTIFPVRWYNERLPKMRGKQRIPFRQEHKLARGIPPGQDYRFFRHVLQISVAIVVSSNRFPSIRPVQK